MRLWKIVLIGACSLLSLSTTAGTSFKKISVTETNNYRLGREYTGLALPAGTGNPIYTRLRGYYQQTKTGKDELNDIISIARWVHLRWTHDPFGSAAPKTDSLTLIQSVTPGAGFSCNEYSKVLRDLLRANGFVSRSVTLQSPDISYAGLGSSHVAVEVYYNRLSKWMLIDAQWGLYPTHHKKPLSVYEIYKLKQANKFAEIEFVSFSGPEAIKRHLNIAEYKKFIASYLGYVSMELMTDTEKVNVIYAMEGKEWPLTFQALPRNAQIFSVRINDIYFPLNQVSLVLRFKPDSQRLQKHAIDFNSEQDYLDKMPQFAAVPDFIITPHNNMPWFDYYEYRIDDSQWRKLEREMFDWHLTSGKNRVEVRAVNRLHRTGPVTFVEITYE